MIFITMRDTLTDGIITLRRYRPADAGDLAEAARESVASVFPWLPWCHEGYTLGEAQGWCACQVKAWKEGQCFEFVIRTAQGDHVGGGGINCLSHEHPFANLGYWVRSSQQGRGYATRAAKLLAEFALGDLGLERVEIMAAVGNHASLRVIEKTGAQREGILRRRLVLHGVAHDAVGYSLVRGDVGERIRNGA